MKLIRKSTVLMLALLLILECFAAPVLATASEEPESVDKPIVSEETFHIEEHQIVSEVVNTGTSEEEILVPASEEDTIVGSGKCGDNLTWTLNSDGLLTISGTGEMYNYGSSAPWTYLFVNEAVVESGVTSIGNGAFYSYNSWLTYLTEITLPDTVVSIGSNAFMGSKIKEIVIPDSVESIGHAAFQGCYIKEIVIPDSVKNIGSHALAGTAITSVQLPKDLTEISDYMFQGCRFLKEITIPETVTKIGRDAFNGCSQLSSFNFHKNLKYLGDYAFKNCGFTSISLPSSITKMEQSVFEDCYKLEEVVLPKKITEVSFALFRGCSKLTSVTIPSTVKTIRTDAFRNCSSLEYIDIPDSVTKVEGGVFMGCKSMQVIVWPKNATVINNMVFSDCTALYAIFLPAKLKQIKDNAFSGCYKLTEVHYLGTESQLKKVKASTWGNDYFINADWYLSTIPTKQPKDVTTISGKTVTFTTAASRSGSKFQWYYLSPDATEWKPASGKSAKTATYSFTAKDKHNGYLYCCLITDTFGGQVETAIATLTIVPKPKITKQPESVTVKNGEEATVTVEAEGEGLKYQWYYASKKSSEFKKASVKTATYSTTMSASRDGRKLYCVITDKHGQKIKTETVSIHIETTPLVITEQPQSVTVKPGETAKVTVSATGDGLKYQWYYAKAGSSSFKKASITKASYSAEMDASRNGRQLYCVVTDQYGKTAKTDIVTINMETVPLLITQQPESITVSSGEEAAVTVKAEGEGLKYQWYYAKKGSSSFKKASITGNTYSVKMDSSRNGRQLYCVITDKYGQTLKTDIVTINME